MYTGTGLSNICLLNQRVEVCATCKTERPILRNPGKLHRAIGIAVALQPTILSGEEMRFLRRGAGYKAGAMAVRLGVNEATYSRWENNKIPLTNNADKIVRLNCLTTLERQRPDQYSGHVAQVIDMQVTNEDPFVIAINVDDVDKPAKYLPETHPMLIEPDATIITGAFITFERTSLETVGSIARDESRAILTKQKDKADVCVTFAAAA